MKAAVVNRYCPPEVVRIAEVEEPTPRDKELLVRVHATRVNRTDCGVRSARPFITTFFYGLRRPRATVLGNEFAGDVVAAGNGVTSFAVGDRVFGFNAGFGGRGQFGAHAEYKVIPADGSLATMPANLIYEAGRSLHRGLDLALGLIRTAGSGAGRQSSSTARPGPSARRRSSS